MNELNRFLGRNALLAANVAAGLLALSSTGASAAIACRGEVCWRVHTALCLPAVSDNSHPRGPLDAPDSDNRRSRALAPGRALHAGVHRAGVWQLRRSRTVAKSAWSDWVAGLDWSAGRMASSRPASSLEPTTPSFDLASVRIGGLPQSQTWCCSRAVDGTASGSRTRSCFNNRRSSASAWRVTTANLPTLLSPDGAQDTQPTWHDASREHPLVRGANPSEPTPRFDQQIF